MATTPTKDYYSLLGIKKTATADEVRKAFRKLARKYHPDVNPGDHKAEERFKEISEANDILSDPKKRKIYDQLGFYSDNIDPKAAEAYGQSGGPAGGAPFGDFGGAQGGRGGSFRDIFSNIFAGGGAAQEPVSATGSDIEHTVQVPFWEA